MAIKGKELGVLYVDCGDVVCFSIDALIHMSEDMGFEDVDSFVKDYGGISCEFHADGGYGVTKTTVVSKDFDTYDAVIIGGPSPKDTLCVLQDEQQTFSEFENNHKLNSVGSWQHIVNDYKDYLKATCTKE